MNASGRVPNAKLYFAARYTEQLVSNYDIKQSDPFFAAQQGIGNCVAKAAISAAMLERAKISDVVPGLAWNKHTHPKIGEDMFGKTRVLNGHAQLLAANNFPPYVVTAISFNPTGQAASNWEMYNFNEDNTYATINNTSFKATKEGEAVGFVIDDWHTSSAKYMEALGITNSVFHVFDRFTIIEGISIALQQRNLLESF